MLDIPILAKDALREGSYKKNYRFKVLDDNGDVDFTIDNDNLVSESVSFDERMASGTTIKFGLCEGTSLEFQYFGKDNIYGRRIYAEVDVYYPENGSLSSVTIPMGYFTVDACSRQASTGIIKVTAYNKLKSDVLDSRANDILIEAYNDGVNNPYIQNVTINYLLSYILENYAIDDRITLESTYVADDFFSDIERYDDPVWAESWLYSSISVRCNVDSSFISSNHVSGYNKVTIRNIQAFKQALRDYFSNLPQPSGVDLFDQGLTCQLKIRYETNSYYYLDLNTYTQDEAVTPYIENVNTGYGYFQLKFPAGVPDAYQSIQPEDYTRAEQFFSILEIKIEKQNPSSPLGNEIIGSDISTWSDVTLRDLQSAVFEVGCLFGRLDRVTDLFAGRELNRSRLYPADTLYPLDTLYPSGGEQASFRSMYSKLWADEGNIQKIRNLIITYKGLDENDQEKEYKLQRQVNADGTQDYNCSDNWVFKNMVWTAQQIADYADIMVGKMQGLTWFPFEMWCAGLPHLETGDEIEIILGEDTYISYILTRTLKGIQNLQDTYINGTLDIF